MYIVRSTIEFKFVDLDEIGEEVEWLQNPLKGIFYWTKLVLWYMAIGKQLLSIQWVDYYKDNFSIEWEITLQIWVSWAMMETTNIPCLIQIGSWQNKGTSSYTSVVHEGVLTNDN